MADKRLPGPLGQTAYPFSVEDGTLSRTSSPAPGPLCGTRATGMRDYVRRVKNVESALLLGLKQYAYRETVAKLDSDVKLVVDSLWPGFVQAVEIYVGSVGGGAIVFGVAGALLSDGVATAPAAIIGAKIGAEIATAVLAFMGAKFLAEYVVAHLNEANQCFQDGFTAAWQACGDQPPVEAARDIGRGVADLVGLLLEAAVAWVVSRGLKAGLDELNKSEAGRALAPYAKIQYWRKELGVTDAPLPRAGIARTIEFFEQQEKKGKLKPMSESDLLSYWKAMDFSKEVKPETLRPGKELVAYRDPKSPFGYFYTEPGTYLDRVGIDYTTDRALPEGVQGPKERVERKFMRYRVRSEVETLKSTSSGVRAFDTKQPVPGGGTQYFIPNAWNVLELVDEPKAAGPVMAPKRQN